MSMLRGHLCNTHNVWGKVLSKDEICMECMCVCNVYIPMYIHVYIQIWSLFRVSVLPPNSYLRFYQF